MSLVANPLLIPVLAVGGTFLWLIIHSIVSSVRDIVKHRNELELKQSLVDRGFSAEEIERIVCSHATDRE